MNQLRSSRIEVMDDEPDVRVAFPTPARPIDHSRQSTGDEFAVRKLVVGRQITFSGEIKSCDTLIIEGSVEGNLADCQLVAIDESGSFTGSAQSDAAEIGGRFDGNLACNRLLIKAGGRVSGLIRYGQIEIEVGGRISGNISAHAIPDLGGDPAETVGRLLQAAFGHATKTATSQAHMTGFAVPGRRENRAIEITPEGRERLLEETRVWSPTDWKAGRSG